MFGYSISGQTQISYIIYIYIWINCNDLTATSLESWLAREIIPKWTLFRLVKYYNLPRSIVNIPLQLDSSIDHCISGNQNLPPQLWHGNLGRWDFFAKTIESRGYGYEILTKESWGCLPTIKPLNGLTRQEFNLFFWIFKVVDMDFKFYLARINHYKLVLPSGKLT